MGEISFNIFNILSILSIFATLLFVLQLYFLKQRNKSTPYFSLYLIVISVIVVFFLIVELDYSKLAVGMLPIFMTAVLSLGPVLWLTVNNVVDGQKIRIIKHLLAPIISGVTFLILLIIVVLLKDEPSGEIFQEVLTYITIIALTILFVLQNGYYIYQSLKLYKEHLNRVGQVFSYTEQVNLSWLKLFVYGYVVFILCLIFSNILDNIWSELLFHVVLLLYLVFSGYNALKHQPIFEVVTENEKDLKDEVDFQAPLFVELKEQLLEVMNGDKLYLDESLTIHSLATKLNTNSKYLSKLINTDFNKSFVVFVNKYRIEEAKRLLTGDQNKLLSIEGIGYKSGFKSKSAFNTAFKKFAGETPSSFLKKGK